MEEESSAASSSSFCQEGVNGQSARRGPFHVPFSAEPVETVGFLDKVDPHETSAFRDELSGGTLSKGVPSECSVDQSESSLAETADLQIMDHKFNEESCVPVKPETESNDATFNSSLPITNAQEPPLEGHTVLDNNGSDALVDVRVCDICGDVGREALLALCSKCSDGAEHIYCMRIKLDKVPEGDWMCEDCLSMQVPKRLKTAEVERSDSGQHPSYAKDVTHGHGLPAMRSGISYFGETKTNHSSKTSCLSAKRPASDLEVTSPSKQRTIEKGIQPLKSSQFGRKMLLKQVSSLKIMGKSEGGGSHVSPFGIKSAVEVMESTWPLSGHKSPKPGSDIEVRPAPKRISLEKSSQPLKSPGSGEKSLLTRVSSLKIIHKGKGSCFQASSFGIQSAKKKIEQESSQSGHTSAKHEPQFQRLKSSTVCGGRSKLNQVSSLKTLDKAKGARFHASFFGPHSVKKEAQQESSHSGHRLPQSVFGITPHLTRVSSLKIIDKGKDAPSRVFRTQSPKKETEGASPPPGHRSPKAEPQCHAGSLSQRKLINIANSNIEVRREDICSKRRTVEGSDDDKLNKCPAKKLHKSISFGGVSSVAATVSNVHLSIASNVENLSYGSKKNSAENRSAQSGLPIAGFDVMKGSPYGTKTLAETISNLHSSSNDVKSMKDIQVDGNSDLKGLGSIACDGQSYEGESDLKAELGSPCREDDAHVLPIDLNTMKNSTPNSADVTPSGIYAVPGSECIWKGAFRLVEGRRIPNYFSGMQAHLSKCASSKVLELVPKFHPELLLKEVPRLNTWPVQFKRSCPTEQDIALYFFAEDLLSHARSYTMLLEGMIRDDLALEANFDGVQLLVFPSSLLPVRSQRWNGLLFLWGVFRVRKVFDWRLHTSSLSAATLNQDLCTPVTYGALNRTPCVSKGGSFLAIHTSDNSTKVPESVDPTVSSSLTKSMDQSFEHEEVSSTEICLGIQEREDHLGGKDDSTTFGDHHTKESFLDTMLHSCDFQKEDGPINSNTHIFPFGLSDKKHMGCVPKFLQEKKTLDVVSRTSFSIDSGPSGSSDGAGCGKSDEGQVEQFQDPSNCETLNLDLCLRLMSEPEEEQVDLDLVLGSPNTSKCKVKHFPKDRSSKHGNMSLFLSLGMPCSNG